MLVAPASVGSVSLRSCCAHFSCFMSLLSKDSNMLVPSFCLVICRQQREPLMSVQTVTAEPSESRALDSPCHGDRLTWDHLASFDLHTLNTAHIGSGVLISQTSYTSQNLHIVDQPVCNQPKNCTLCDNFASATLLAGCEICEPGRGMTHRVGANGDLAAQGLSHLIKCWRYVRLIRNRQPHYHAVKWHELSFCQKLLPCNLQ